MSNTLSFAEAEAFINKRTKYLNYYAYKEYSNTKDTLAVVNKTKFIVEDKLPYPSITGEEFIEKYYEFGKFNHVCLWIPYLAKEHQLYISQQDLYLAVANNRPDPIIYARDYFTQAKGYKHIGEEQTGEDSDE